MKSRTAFLRSAVPSLHAAPGAGVLSRQWNMRGAFWRGYTAGGGAGGWWCMLLRSGCGLWVWPVAWGPAAAVRLPLALPVVSILLFNKGI